MNSLDRYQPSGMLRGVGRASRTVARIEASAGVQLARIEALAEIQAYTADEGHRVGRHAMQDVAMLSQVESQLAQAVPHASGRLAAIADLTAIALSEVVADTTRKLGRV
jgi:hypothetical protein